MKNISFNFDLNDETIIKSCLFFIEGFQDDNCILYILIDLFYFYLKAYNVFDENIENELKTMINAKEIILNNELISLLVKLSNFIQIKLNSLK